MPSKKPLAPTQRRKAESNAQELSKLIKKSTYFRKKKEVHITFNDSSLTELITLFMGEKAKKSIFGNSMTFQVTEEFSAEDILMLLKMVDKIK